MKKLLLLFTCVILFQFSNGQNITGKILFSRHSYNNSATPDSIFAMNNDGKTLTFVTLGYRPRLSHNGKWMAFCNGPISNDSYEANLWMRDLTLQKDTEIKILSDYLDYYDFSPDDKRLVLSYECAIYTCDLNGGNTITILNRDCYTDDPTDRSADSLVAYHDLHEGISTMNFNGSGDSRLPHTYPRDLFPVWSPDGQWIAYEKNIPQPAGDYLLYNIYKIKPTGDDSTQLSFFPASDTICPDVVWAKDMQTLFFIGKISDTIGIYQLHTDGGGTYKRIFNFNDNSPFAYYVSARGYYLYHYWLGLADSIFSNKVVTNYCDSLSANFSYTNTDINYHFTDLSKAAQGFSLAWKWNFGDNPSGASDSSSLQNPSHSFATANTYNVCLTVKAIGQSDTCSSTKCEAITTSPSGVVNINDPNTFKLSPNPTDGSFQITVPAGVSGTNQLFIMNMLGEKVYEGTITSANTKLALDIPEGIYFVSIFSNENQFTQRLVIQK